MDKKGVGFHFLRRAAAAEMKGSQPMPLAPCPADVSNSTTAMRRTAIVIFETRVSGNCMPAKFLVRDYGQLAAALLDA